MQIPQLMPTFVLALTPTLPLSLSLSQCVKRDSISFPAPRPGPDD